jgi:hypothetical protein
MERHPLQPPPKSKVRISGETLIPTLAGDGEGEDVIGDGKDHNGSRTERVKI